MITQQAKSQFCEVPIKLPIFSALPDSFATGSKSPRSFAFVGLGIVAAMGGSEAASGTLRPAGAQAHSDPIPIAPRERCGAAEEEMELSESYTCVISHAGRGSVRKKVYYCMDGGEGRNCTGTDMDTDTGMCGGSCGRPGLFYQSSPATPVAVSGLDFLKCCWRCGKRLEGIDIFMYRGEKAFCSPECRQQQIMADEYRTPKSHKPFDFSASPCSISMLVAAGVAAA